MLVVFFGTQLAVFAVNSGRNEREKRRVFVERGNYVFVSNKTKYHCFQAEHESNYS